MSDFRISNLECRDSQLYIAWSHGFSKTDNFCVILDQDGSCEFRTTRNQKEVLLENVVPGEYLVKVQVLADGEIRETPGKIITVA